VLGEFLCAIDERDVSMSNKNNPESFMQLKWVQFALSALFLLYFIIKIFS
jgi:hypothetical protein